jgi:hypothetical protein
MAVDRVRVGLTSKQAASTVGTVVLLEGVREEHSTTRFAFLIASTFPFLITFVREPKNKQ